MCSFGPEIRDDIYTDEERFGFLDLELIDSGELHTEYLGGWESWRASADLFRSKAISSPDLDLGVGITQLLANGDAEVGQSFRN